MRPYLAIIKDSFRAAMASKVLYVLLGLITLILLVLAPAHIRETLDTRITDGEGRDVPNSILLVDRLHGDKDDAERPGIQRIWEKLPDDLKSEIERVSSDDEDSQKNTPARPSDMEKLRVGSSLVDALNVLITDQSFYRKQDWSQRSYGIEASDLMENYDSLSGPQKERLNRVLISEAFGATVKSGAQTALAGYYGWYEISFLRTPSTQQQFASYLTTSLPKYFDKFVLSIGLLIAILVTANIVPQTFEPGTLNLLLSKPLSRSGLFLAKFFGGCAFITLCATLLFVGLWLWMGICLKVWDRAILFSIPLYVVVFAIYFSVSSFVGLTTRSTILAVVITGVFWATCFAVGLTYQFFSSRMEGIEISRMFQNGEQLYQLDPTGNFKTWDATSDSWAQAETPKMDDEEQMARAFLSYVSADGLPTVLGPVSTNDDEVVTSRFMITKQSTFGRQTLLSSTKGSAFEEKGRFPRDTVLLRPSQQGLVAITSRGEFWRYDPSLLTPVEQTQTLAENKQDKKDTAKKDTAKNKDPFVSLGPKTKKNINNHKLADLNWSNSEIATYNRGNLSVFRFNSQTNQYQLHRSVTVDTGSNPGMSCRVAYQGNTILVVLGNGQIISFQGDTLKEQKGYLPESRVVAQSVTASRDGRWFAVCYRDETLWLLDTQNDQQMTKPNITGQGTISLANFNEQGQMLVADRTDRVTAYDLDGLSKHKTWSPGGDTMDKIWRWGVRPLYTVFPKPGEFYRVVTHLSNANDTSENRDVDLEFTSDTENPWSPLFSGLNFMAIMLFLSCLWFWRTDY